jgi:FkbM family methyltransferase
VKGAIDHPHQLYGGRTYSQYGEDLVVLNIFHRLNVDRPSYIDIGAHHPFDLSNTALLYQRGSRGINVEANPDLLPAFSKHRSQDVNISVGVGPHRGRAPFYRSRSNLSSGRNSFLRDAVEPLGIAGILEVDLTTVDDIITEHGRGVVPDFMSIDIEGMDHAVLEGMACRPSVVCAEAVAPGSDTPMIKLMQDRGYFLVLRACHNLILVRNDLHGRLY